MGRHSNQNLFLPILQGFSPGGELPEYPGGYIYIGNCTHCDKTIHAVIQIQRDLKQERLISEWREANKHARCLPKALRHNGTRYILVRYE